MVGELCVSNNHLLRLGTACKQIGDSLENKFQSRSLIMNYIQFVKIQSVLYLFQGLSNIFGAR